MGEEDQVGKDEYMSSAMVAIKKYNFTSLLKFVVIMQGNVTEMQRKQGYH